MTKGIVYNTLTGKVVYKYSTPDHPTLQPDESLKDRDDADDIQVGATYDPKTDKYTNPTPLKVKELKDWKAEYASSKDTNQKLDILAKFIGLRD